MKLKEGETLQVGDLTMVLVKKTEDAFELKISNLKKGDMILAGDKVVSVNEVFVHTVKLATKAIRSVQIKRF